MPVRIGGRDPRFKNIGGPNMRNIERMFQLMVSLQILFGSRRGVTLLLPLLIIGAVVVVGWLAFNALYSPQRKLELAHADWNSGVTQRQMDAIRQYQQLLLMDNPVEPGMRWLQNDRDTLYRRIIEHEVIYQKNDRTAREWSIRAWDEGIRDLRLPEGEARSFWERTVRSLQDDARKDVGNSNHPIPQFGRQNFVLAFGYCS